MRGLRKYLVNDFARQESDRSSSHSSAHLASGWYRNVSAALCTVLVAVGLPAGGLAQAQPADGEAIPCAPMPMDQAEILRAFRQSFITPDQKVDYAVFTNSPAMRALRQDEEQRRFSDYGNLCRYAEANARLKDKSALDVVFIGDSITENWAQADVALFDGQKVVGRGIGGQTTPQMLLRFYADVVALHPKVVHIMAGTNDVAGNTGYRSDADIENNLRAMTELAQANGIRVILASIPPAAAFSWAPDVKPSNRIARLNDFIQQYAKRRGAVFVDYFKILNNGSGGLRSDLSNDGVHPNSRGYGVMKKLAKQALRDANISK